MSTNSVVFVKNAHKGTYVQYDGRDVGSALEEIAKQHGTGFVLNALKSNKFRGFSCIDPDVSMFPDEMRGHLVPSSVEYVEHGFGIGFSEEKMVAFSRKMAKEHNHIEYVWNFDPVTGKVTKIKGNSSH